MATSSVTARPTERASANKSSSTASQTRLLARGKRRIFWLILSLIYVFPSEKYVFRAGIYVFSSSIYVFSSSIYVFRREKYGEGISGWLLPH